MNKESSLRAICLERSSSKGPVRDVLGVGPRAVGNAGGGGDGVLVGRSVDGVGDPGVPQGLNLATVAEQVRLMLRWDH